MKHCQAPDPSFRLIPSKFPPIGLFETVSTSADLDAVMDLVGWTNDRLVADRVARLPVEERIYGHPNASVVMASFLHVASAGSRFNSADLGAWYASDSLAAAAAEVGHHLRREVFATSVSGLSRTFRTYKASLAGRFVDILGKSRDLREIYAPDSYAASQAYGERLRAAGEDGIAYNSVRMRGGTNAVCFRPSLVRDVVQTDHYEISASRDARRITVTKLNR